MKRFVHPKSGIDQIREFEVRRNDLMNSTSSEIESSELIDDYDENGILDESDQFEYVDRKDVMDSDGFYTKYSLYYDVLNDRYVTVFGDPDLYRPEDGDYDAEFDSEWEAREWFDSYTGFEDEDLI